MNVSWSPEKRGLQRCVTIFFFAMLAETRENRKIYLVVVYVDNEICSRILQRETSFKTTAYFVKKVRLNFRWVNVNNIILIKTATPYCKIIPG